VTLQTTDQILVTGGTGFLGKSVCAQLKGRGYERVVPVGSRDYDLRNQAEVIRMFRSVRPTVLLHLAAVVGGIGANRQHPGRFFYDNALMGLHVMEQARIAGVTKLVLIGTVCSYPGDTAPPFSEDELWNGFPEETNAPYGLAKRMLFVQADAYRKEYGFNAISLIPTNLYGPGDNFDPETSHVIPALVLKCIEAKESGLSGISVWGDGTATREFLYVDDAARGIVDAMERYDGGSPVNLGSGREVTIRELVTLIAGLTGFKGKVSWDRSMPNGQAVRHVDSSRARRLFGFSPGITLEEGLRMTIDGIMELRRAERQTIAPTRTRG